MEVTNTKYFKMETNDYWTGNDRILLYSEYFIYDVKYFRVFIGDPKTFKIYRIEVYKNAISSTEFDYETKDKIEIGALEFNNLYMQNYIINNTEIQ